MNRRVSSEPFLLIWPTATRKTSLIHLKMLMEGDRPLPPTPRFSSCACFSFQVSGRRKLPGYLSYLVFFGLYRSAQSIWLHPLNSLTAECLLLQLCSLSTQDFRDRPGLTCWLPLSTVTASIFLCAWPSSRTDSVIPGRQPTFAPFCISSEKNPPPSGTHSRIP